MAVNNNLYPPIIETYMPAFLIDQGVCRIYFSLSSFNSFDDIINAQVTIRHQATNASVLNSNIYPSEIMLLSIHQDPNRADVDDRYYIEVKNSDIINGSFEINQYYKVQIRFTKNGASALPSGVDLEARDEAHKQAIDTWLAGNSSLFSEWSTVCLIRGISKPNLNIPNFQTSGEGINYLSDTNIDINGSLEFADPAEKETLRSYQFLLYDSKDQLLTDSGLLYSSDYCDYNSLIYTIKYNLVESEEYRLVVKYTTQNLFEDEKEYKFIVIQSYTEKLDVDMNYIMDEENGAIGINIRAKEGVDPIIGNITIRRTSSNTNFTIWEDIHSFSVVENQELDYTWYDYTIESGVWYRYCAQKRSATGQRGVITELKEPRMMIFEEYNLIHLYLHLKEM